MKTRKMPLMFKYHTFRPISNKQYLTNRFQVITDDVKLW